MLRTSGNTLKTNNSANVNNVKCGTNNNNSINKSNLLNSAGLVNSDYMLPLNNLSNNNNNNQMATSSFLNDYNKLYRDLEILHQQNQHSNLIGNNSMNSLVVNNLTNNIGSHTNNLNNLPNHNNNVNGLPNHNNLNVLPSNLQQQQSNGKNISNEFLFFLNRCNQYLSLNMYQNALDDSNQALNIASNSSEARFRKAQALLGLKRFYDCEKELWTCIKLDPSSIEYRKELVKLKQIALMSLNLNLDQNQIIMASQKYDTIKEAVEALLWQNNMDNFPYSPFNNNANNTNNLSDNLINGWGLANNNNTSNNNSNRFRSNFNPINNQLVNNGNNLLFSNNLLSNVNNNLLLNNSNLINRSNNGNSLNNNCVNSSTAQTSNNNINSGLNNIKNNSTANSTTTANLNNNLINSNNSSNQNNSTVIGNQSSNNSVNNNINETNNNANLISNGLSNVSLNNGNNRFNFLLRGLDSQAHLSQINSQQTTNGQNSNQNLINNNIYNRIMPTFIENNNSSNMETKNHAAVTNNQILNCSRNLSNKINSNSNSILNGTNGLLMMNNNNAPSPICSKINNGINSNLSSNSTSLTNSCNFNPFNQLPDVKLIETIVPNLLTLGNSASSSLNNSEVNDPLANSNKLKMFSSIKKEVNNNLKDNPKTVDNFNVSKKDSNILSYEDCNKSANNIKNNATKKPSELDTNDLIKNKDLDLKSVTNVVDDNNLNNSSLQNNVHNINSLNANSNTKTVLSNEENNLNTNILNNNQNNNGTFVVNSTSANTIQSTSYSDIVKRAKKVTQNALGNTSLNNNTKSEGSAVSVKSENENLDDASIATKRPTNLWAYNGLRVANVSLTASKSSLLNLFSKFGRIRLLERIINKTTTNNIWVYYDNPVSPVDAVAKLQNLFIENICVDIDSPLRLFFAPTDDQKDLKFSRPKQPPDNKGECYYWRTTNCFSKDQCPLLHLQPNKNIDAQIWMKMNKEPEDTDVVPIANTTCSTSTSTSAENNEITSDL